MVAREGTPHLIPTQLVANKAGLTGRRACFARAAQSLSCVSDLMSPRVTEVGIREEGVGYPPLDAHGR